MNALERLEQVDAQWSAAEVIASDLKEELFEAFAAAVREGHTPDELAAYLKARKTPEQIEAGLSFSGAYIRRRVRSFGIPALPTGPKSRKPPTDATAGE